MIPVRWTHFKDACRLSHFSDLLPLQTNFRLIFVWMGGGCWFVLFLIVDICGLKHVFKMWGCMHESQSRFTSICIILFRGNHLEGHHRKCVFYDNIGDKPYDTLRYSRYQTIFYLCFNGTDLNIYPVKSYSWFYTYVICFCEFILAWNVQFSQKQKLYWSEILISVHFIQHYMLAW